MKDKLLSWLTAAGIRAIKTFAQAAAALVPTSAVALGDVDWLLVVSSAAVAAILSLLTSVAGLPELKDKEVIDSLLDDKYNNNDDETISSIVDEYIR